MHETTYITTPIFYVNDAPHIGHVFTTTLADIAARHARANGCETFLLTGTDEHATKVVEAAAARNLAPQQWADQNAEAFRSTFGRLQLSFDDFIRTTEERHKTRVVAYFRALIQAGDVYLGNYEGWYDAGQEEYVPDNKARECNYQSPINRKPLVRKTEQNYFFRLSAYRQALLEHYQAHPHFVRPEARRNEILNRIAEADDIPISRTGMGEWGIKIPGDERHSVYVWFDALCNYLSAIDTDQRRHFWSDEPGAVHTLAKDILWFHAAIWPAMLLALRKCAGFEWVRLPRLIYAHSFWISEGQKMSKTLGNFIDLKAIDGYVATYGLDALRYYLVAHGPLGVQDANFSSSHFHKVYHDDLVNTVGNCASRVTAMIGKYFDARMPAYSDAAAAVASNPQAAAPNLPASARDAVAAYVRAMEAFDLSAALSQAIGLVRAVDVFVNATEPFKVAKDAARKDELGSILYQCAEAIRIAGVLLETFLITKMPELQRALGASDGEKRFSDRARWGGLVAGDPVMKVALYPRVEAPQSP